MVLVMLPAVRLHVAPVRYVKLDVHAQELPSVVLLPVFEQAVVFPDRLRPFAYRAAVGAYLMV